MGAPPPVDPALRAWLIRNNVAPDFVPVYEHVKMMVWGMAPEPPFDKARVDKAVEAWAANAAPAQLKTMQDVGYQLVRYFTESQGSAAGPSEPAPAASPPPPPGSKKSKKDKAMADLMSVVGGLEKADFGAVVGIDGSEDEEEDEDEDKDKEEQEDEEEDGEEEGDDADESQLEPEPEAAKQGPGAEPEEELSVDWRAVSPAGAAQSRERQGSKPIPQVAAASGLAVESGAYPVRRTPSGDSNPGTPYKPPSQDGGFFSSGIGKALIGIVVVASVAIGLRMAGVIGGAGSDNPDVRAMELLGDGSSEEATEFLSGSNGSFSEWGYAGRPMQFIDLAYETGAVNVWAADIKSVTGAPEASALIVQLPADDAERTAFLAWCDLDYPGLCTGAGRQYIVVQND
jgi:hypothetical protein